MAANKKSRQTAFRYPELANYLYFPVWFRLGSLVLNRCGQDSKPIRKQTGTKWKPTPTGKSSPEHTFGRKTQFGGSDSALWPPLTALTSRPLAGRLRLILRVVLMVDGLGLSEAGFRGRLSSECTVHRRQQPSKIVQAPQVSFVLLLLLSAPLALGREKLISISPQQ